MDTLPRSLNVLTTLRPGKLDNVSTPAGMGADATINNDSQL
jgi:hypothetical protein